MLVETTNYFNSTLPDEMSTDTADNAIRQREGLLWRLCLTKPNKKDTAPKETASAVRASATKMNQLRVSFIVYLHTC